MVRKNYRSAQKPSKDHRWNISPLTCNGEIVLDMPNRFSYPPPEDRAFLSPRTESPIGDEPDRPLNDANRESDMTENYRIEKDSMGELKVPADALYGAQTQRAIDNFPVSGIPMPAAFIRAIALIKQCAAEVNVGTGRARREIGRAIAEAAGRSSRGSTASNSRWMSSRPARAPAPT